MGAILFIAAEFWRDYYPPTSATTRLGRFVLVIGSLILLGLSYRAPRS
jgi:hypothetical protein